MMGTESMHRGTTLRLRNSAIKLSPGVIVGVAVLSCLMLAGLFAPLPFDPLQPGTGRPFSPPSSTHWFGTDGAGFDVFTRVVAASTRDLPLAIAGTLVSLVAGTVLGLAASQPRGEWLMRALDAFQSFPLLILAIALVTILGDNVSNVVVAIAIINVPRFMRLVRSEALILREKRFIEAAISFGASRTRIAFRHILPNVWGITLAQSSLAAAHSLVVIASLSFLGVGVSPPEPSWGSMIQDGARDMATGQWWTVAFPGMAVVLCVLMLNLIADSLHAELE